MTERGALVGEMRTFRYVETKKAGSVVRCAVNQNPGTMSCTATGRRSRHTVHLRSASSHSHPRPHRRRRSNGPPSTPPIPMGPESRALDRTHQRRPQGTSFPSLPSFSLLSQRGFEARPRQRRDREGRRRRERSRGKIGSAPIGRRLARLATQGRYVEIRTERKDGSLALRVSGRVSRSATDSRGAGWLAEQLRAGKGRLPDSQPISIPRQCWARHREVPRRSAGAGSTATCYSRWS